jgi:hypothetical protein
MASNVITLGEREFKLGKPTTQHWLNVLRFAKYLIENGYGDALNRIAGMEKGQEILILFTVIEPLKVNDLNMLGALLLQFDDLDEGAAFVAESGGAELDWLLEAFAINVEQAGWSEIVKSFRRVTAALQSTSTGTGAEAQRSASAG